MFRFVFVSDFHLFSTAVTAQPTPTIEQITSAVVKQLNVHEISVTTAVNCCNNLKETTVARENASDFNIDLIGSYPTLESNITEFFQIL